MKQKKLILVKLIGIGNDESKRINNDDKDENDSIEKEGYKYSEVQQKEQFSRQNQALQFEEIFNNIIK